MVVEGSSDARGGRRGCMAWSTESAASYLSSWWARSLATCILVSFDSPCVLKNMKQKCRMRGAVCSGLAGNCRFPVDQDRRPNLVLTFSSGWCFNAQEIIRSSSNGEPQLLAFGSIRQSENEITLARAVFPMRNAFSSMLHDWIELNKRIALKTNGQVWYLQWQLSLDPCRHNRFTKTREKFCSGKHIEKIKKKKKKEREREREREKLILHEPRQSHSSEKQSPWERLARLDPDRERDEALL